MKIKRIVSLLLITALSVITLASCASEGKAVMTFGESSVSSNMFSYMMSSQKQYMKQSFEEYVAYYYYYYQQQPDIVDFDDYLKSEYTDDDGNTVKVVDSTYDMIVESAKAFLVVKELSRKNGIKLTNQEMLDSIDEYIKEQIDTAGSEEFLNITLAKYGADIDIMHDYLYGMALQDDLYEFLYGENGTQRISDDAVKTYFNENYTKIDVAYFPFYKTDETTGSAVPVTDDSITEEDKKAYFEDTYASVRHVLFYNININNGNPLDEETVAANKAKAEDTLAKLQNGELTLDDAIKNLSEDKGTDGVVFRKGDLDPRLASLEEEAFKMEKDSYSVVKTDIGYHVIYRAPLTDADYAKVKTEIESELVVKSITEKANTFVADVKSGKTSFDDAEKFSSFCKLSKNVIFTAGELDESMEKEIAKLEKAGDICVFPNDEAVFIVRKGEFSDDDYRERYDDAYASLGEKAFTEYIKSFYPEIVIDEKELAKFDLLTCEAIEILAMDPVNDEQ